MSDLVLALLQTELAWESCKDNLKVLDKALDGLPANTDLIVLPEVFASGFSMATGRIAQSMDGEAVQWMQATADNLNCAICGSLAISENNKVYNRFIFASSRSPIRYYDKRHLFRMGNEHLHYAAGHERVVWEWRGWRICPMVCYDLRFPVWSRNQEDYDLLLYVANWPAARSKQWRQLLIARAIENQAYVAGVNRIGQDGKGIDHAGDSLAICPKGELLVDAADQAGWHKAQLDKTLLEKYRQSFPVAKDADLFTILPD